MQRYEKKYLLTFEQAEKLKSFLSAKISLDVHHVGDEPYHIHSYYFDNSDHKIIKMSMESPAFKEKIRLRIYGNENPMMFIETKKKFLGQSYKYRKSIDKDVAQNILNLDFKDIDSDSIDDRRMYDMILQYNLKPHIELHYDRLAFENAMEGIRVTFDTNLSYKYVSQSKSTKLFGDYVILEVKCHRAFPMWISKYLSEQRLHHQSLSKYGSSYTHYTKGALDVINY
jgi:SPX domain protein involved in polyphosphate accumulation